MSGEGSLETRNSRLNTRLARLIRGSPLLDTVTKRQWVKVLSHLSPSDRARLEEILRSVETRGLSDPAPRG